MNSILSIIFLFFTCKQVTLSVMDMIDVVQFSEDFHVQTMLLLPYDTRF
jgi:hypothetical protein